MKFVSEYYLVDIDGTLTDYRPGANFELLHGNFLFPIIRDMMVEEGWERRKAEKAIFKLIQEEIFWDYSDFISAFSLPPAETFAKCRQWHKENILPYLEMVKLVRRLAKEGYTLLIMSNNPYLGCVFKLQAAGLAEDDFSSSYFARILGTNLLRGCKSDPAVWKRALAQIPAPASKVGVIGDNPVEDGEIPRSLGISDTIILPRGGIPKATSLTEKRGKWRKRQEAGHPFYMNGKL